MSLVDEYNNKIYENVDDVDELEIEKIKTYLYELSLLDCWIDKRTNFAFSRNKWLYDVINKDDLKQDFYLKLFSQASIKSIMKRDVIGRIKYMNSIFSTTLFNNIYKYYGKPTYALNDEMIITQSEESNNEIEQNINSLFLDETIESKVISLIKKGMTGKEIMEMLSLSRRNYDKIKDTIKNKIIESESD